jgi:hypothetical protein
MSRVLALAPRMHESLVALGVWEPLDELMGRLGRPVAYVVGGFPRDLIRLENDRDVEPKDVDVVVDTADLARELAAMRGRRETTPLGGFRWTPPGSRVPVDIWQLADTIWIRELHLKPTIESLLAGVDLDMDRAAISLDGSDERVDDAREALSTGEIRSNPIPECKISDLAEDEMARALLLSWKTGFTLSPALERQLEKTDRMALVDRAWSRFPREGYTPQEIGLVLEQVALT